MKFLNFFFYLKRNENKKMQDVPNAVLPVNFTSVPDKHLFFNNSRSSMYHLLVMHQRLMGIQNKYRGGNMYLTCTFEADLYQTVFRLNLTMCPEGMFNRFIKIKINVCLFVCT